MDTGRPGPAEAESSKTSPSLSTPALRKVDLPPAGLAQVDKHRRHPTDVLRADRRSKAATSSMSRRNIHWPLAHPGSSRKTSEGTAVEPATPGLSDEYDLCEFGLLQGVPFGLFEQLRKACYSCLSKRSAPLRPRLYADPKLFQDIQRALAAKARREARLGTANAPSTHRDSIPFPEKDSISSGSSAPRTTSNNATPVRIGTTSDLDFSPSTSLPLRTHPVPTSSDDGVTLDWAGMFSGHERHERRWTLSISKRKDKGKAPLNSVLIEKQESLHTGE
jgi:hypothetical protein